MDKNCFHQTSVGSPKYFAFIILLLMSAGLLSCGGQPVKPQAQTTANKGTEIADLYVVDCLLPGQVRQLGSTSYMTPRRPVITTAADCRIRGGEYVAYDRADYKTALQVWLPTAETGDAEAQVNVGEIFERGAGGEPNYAAALVWYQKAAEKNNARAQFNLGTLYEQGLGVPKDKVVALNWYRKAWGMAQDDVIFQSAAQGAQDEIRAQLQKVLAEKATQITLLNNQIKALQTARPKAGATQETEQQLAQLKVWVGNLEKEKYVAKNDIDKLPPLVPHLREPKANTAAITKAGSATDIKKDNLHFGKYYALIIANQNYENISSLLTPFADAKRAKQILEEKYGFTVSLLLDGNNTTIMKAINDLDSQLTENDNLLIFYAGHGSRMQAGGIEAGYWLPANASAPPDDTFWVSNEFVTRHLARTKAKRVLVVADSCYAGLLSSEPGYLFMGDKQKYTNEYIQYKLPKKSRLLLSSGGDTPVLDNAGEGHSVFARAFLDALDGAQGILSGPELFLKIKDQVTAKAKAINFVQLPEFKVIKGTGHEVGDFFFIRK
ncbi:MAG: caspase family protein [Pseudomonadota bacterium]